MIYEVTLKSSQCVYVTVEADNEEAAKELAEEIFYKDPDDDRITSNIGTYDDDDWEAVSVEEKK